MIGYKFTPKKFLDVLYLRGIKLTNLVSHGIDRSYFIPRYKSGLKKLNELDYSYRKVLRLSSIEKIASVLTQWGIASSEEQVIGCLKSTILTPFYPMTYYDFLIIKF